MKRERVAAAWNAYGLKETDNSERTIDQVVLVDVVEGSPSADRAFDRSSATLAIRIS